MYLEEKSTNDPNFKRELARLNVILHFWVELQINVHEKRVNDKLTFELFSYMFSWWKEFLIPFKNKYEERRKEHNKKITEQNSSTREKIVESPPWVESIEWLKNNFPTNKKKSEIMKDKLIIPIILEFFLILFLIFY